jgi:hypothetical protein
LIDLFRFGYGRILLFLSDSDPEHWDPNLALKINADPDPGSILKNMFFSKKNSMVTFNESKVTFNHFIPIT